jgi:hypothetical protein
MSLFAREFYLESHPDTRFREVLPKYRHINAKLECLYRDSLIGVSLEPGVLSELVVKDYLEDMFGKENVSFAAKKQKGFDLIVKKENTEQKIQVKSKELSSWVDKEKNRTRSYHYHEFTEKNSGFDILYTVFIGTTFVWVCNPIKNPKKSDPDTKRFKLNNLYGDDFIDCVIDRSRKEWNKFGLEITNYKVNI